MFSSYHSVRYGASGPGLCLDCDLGSRGKSLRPTELSVFTANTVGNQYVDRGYNKEVIHTGSDEDNDFGDERTQQAGTGERRNGRIASKDWPSALAKNSKHGILSHFTLN